MTVSTRSYLDWQATLDPGQIYSRPPSPQYPVFYNEKLYYLEQRAAEGGRSVIVRESKSGERETLTPENFNIRSRVHEYGGKAFLIASGHLWFSNDSDGRIYRQVLDPEALPEAISEAESRAMAIDFLLTPDQKFLLFVQETPVEGAENENRLSILPLVNNSAGSVSSLVSGADFYANPVISPDGSQLAWVEWDHPQMPWDGTRLMTAQLVVKDGLLTPADGATRRIAGGEQCSVCQLHYSSTGKLFFVLDGVDEEQGLIVDCWSLFCWDGSEVSRITHDHGEYGEGHWIFGQQRYLATADDTILAIRTVNGKDELVEVNTASSAVQLIENEKSTSLSHLSRSVDGEVFYTAAGCDSTSEVHSYSAASGKIRHWTRSESLLAATDISKPRHLTFATSEGGKAHAWYYRPLNHRYQAPTGELPPLLVMVHGGPTSRCDSALDYLRQFWTGRGFAVLDVNHRGSTGYCREFRQSLQKQWGIFDCIDVAEAVKHVIVNKLANPEQVCIRGGSAGGYVVLRALTLYPDLFAAGACYYGIGNLVTLMEYTHKFEARYLDGLLGEAYRGKQSDQPGSPYYDRSPVHDMEKLQSPMIIFQGQEDKVVPPRLSHELVDVLERKGIRHQYVEYPGEGHGFRRKETRIDALEKEVEFFVSVIGSQGVAG